MKNTHRKSPGPAHWRKRVATIQDQARGLLLVALTTRQSIFDIIALRWGDVDFEKRFIRFRRTQSRRVVKAPLDDCVRTWIRRHPRPADPNLRLFVELAEHVCPHVQAQTLPAQDPGVGHV